MIRRTNEKVDIFGQSPFSIIQTADWNFPRKQVITAEEQDVSRLIENMSDPSCQPIPEDSYPA